MAVNDAFTSQQPNSNQTPNSSVPPVTNVSSSGPTWSLTGSGLFGAPISGAVGSELLTKIRDKLEEVYKTAHPDAEITLICLDRENIKKLAFSAIVVCIRMRSAPTQGAAWHVLIIEATGEKIPPVYETFNNQQIEIYRVTGEALDRELIEVASQAVSRIYPNTPSYMVDGCVVPREFNPEDKTSVHYLALNAGLAAGNELEFHKPDFVDMNLATVSGRDANLVVNIAFNRQQIADACGSPMRSDVLVQFTSQAARGEMNRQVSINSGARESVISSMSAFIDLIYIQNRALQGFQGRFQAMNGYPQQNQMPSYFYAPRMVITNIASSASYTLGSVLLTLSTALAARENNNWIQSFRPTMTSGDGFDPHDIGALNIDANLKGEPGLFGTRVDVKNDKFKMEELGQYIGALIQPGLIVSLDVPECGPQTWYSSVFLAASIGKDPHPAYMAIYNAANTLTNGHFSRYFAEGMPIFTDIGNRVHLGHWTDRSGQKRDLRDFDYLAVVNYFGETSPTFIRDWSDTWVPECGPLNVRLAQRKRMLLGLSGDSAEFTGFAQRITFTSAFMDALGKSVRDANPNVRIMTPLNTSDFNNQRGVANFVNSALIAPGQGFFNPGGAFGQPNFTPGMFVGNNRQWRQ
jgi:hypothetical protein